MIHRTKNRIAFEIFNYIGFTLICLSILLPFLNVIAISLSSYDAITRGGIGLWPKGLNIDAYKSLAVNTQFLRTAMNTVFLTFTNTVLVIIISLAAGYALSSKYLVGKKIVFTYFIIPMYFSGGLIPTYLLINGIHLNNTYMALILPSIVNIFYIIVFKNMIDQLPKELVESAEIDGAGQPLILFEIIIPLIVPTIAAFIVFSAVGYWNEWFSAMIYLRDRKMWTLQLQLRDILISASMVNSETQASLIGGELPIHPENLKMSALMLTILPIIVIYPFVQKYFMSGVLVGAVKG